MPSLYNLDKTQPRPPLPPFEPNPRLNDPALYEPSAELADAIDVALLLGQPLLVTGEPGTGKTELANHLAWYFNLGALIRLNVQTTSTANDLFYSYDALAHFQYSQNQAEALSAEELERRFIRYQALGRAIVSGGRRVVLLDEIDKAPRDLPNDLLAALEDLEFYVPEIDKTYRAEPANRPVIVLTSNSEKNLPDPFLRRVVYFHITFPERDKLLKIVSAKVPGFPEDKLQPLVAHFEGIRNDDSLKLQKKPATAELIQWAYLLQQSGFDPAKLERPKQMSAEERQQLLGSYSVLAKTREDLKALKGRG
ncbi:MAG: MoxR family ATPase [Phaeodactylibacter sp.]|nr:MoxR family ATPase [Phaeodactylibacter sp.]MCB9291743.1 MoxR family ATPase [Lewinellaceae bacterium]